MKSPFGVTATRVAAAEELRNTANARWEHSQPLRSKENDRWQLPQPLGNTANDRWQYFQRLRSYKNDFSVSKKMPILKNIQNNI